MRRGEVYDARLDPTEGSEQVGTRPVIIVSRDAINATSQVILAVPCTSYYPSRQTYPSQVVLQVPNGGLDRDSVALGEQVRVKRKNSPNAAAGCTFRFRTGTTESSVTNYSRFVWAVNRVVQKSLVNYSPVSY